VGFWRGDYRAGGCRDQDKQTKQKSGISRKSEAVGEDQAKEGTRW
jgi:hypothetical protein